MIKWLLKLIGKTPESFGPIAEPERLLSREGWYRRHDGETVPVVKLFGMWVSQSNPGAVFEYVNSLDGKVYEPPSASAYDLIEYVRDFTDLECDLLLDGHSLL